MSDMWTDIGIDAVPVEDRDTFASTLDTVEWVAPRGTHPVAPALALRSVIREFDIKPVTAVSYNVPRVPYTVLGVRTRKQAMFFIDLGTQVTPVLIRDLPDPVGPLCGCELPISADVAAAAECGEGRDG